MNIKLTHTLHDCIELHYREVLLFRYIYEPKTEATESPKPYFHPLCTLAGNEVTSFRPYDHVWHKGLAMTSANLSGENFWGGPTYVHGKGYVQLDNNGRIQHQAWEDIQAEGNKVSLKERLEWITHKGERWVYEERLIDVDEIDSQKGYWSLDLRFSLKNVRGQPLTFGSPTTAGRPMAGYGGLFWRGPRSFLHGTVLAGGELQGPEIMGKAAPWLAYIGRHDGTGGRSTVLFLDHPDNPRFPNKWFIRNDPFAAVSCSFMFDEEYGLEPDDGLVLRYMVTLIDGEWSREQIEAYRSGAVGGGLTR